MSQLPVLVTASHCPWSQRAVMEARRLGLLPKLQVVSVNDRATRKWFLGPNIGGSVTPTLFVQGVKHEEYPVVLSAMQKLAGQPLPAGQVASPARAGSGPQKAQPAVYAMYVSKTCGACAKALQLVASSPKLLRAIEVRQLDGNPRYILDVHETGARKTPILVEFIGGRVTNVYEGTAAWSKLIELG